MAQAKESPALLAPGRGASPADPFGRRELSTPLTVSHRLSAGPYWGPLAFGIVAILAGLGASPTSPTSQPISKDASALNTLTFVQRTVCQCQGAWQVDYRFRNSGATGVVVTPDEIAAKVEGWVSNSRIASHAVPRWSSVAISKENRLTGDREVIAAPEEAKRCKERLIVSLWPDDAEDCSATTASSSSASPAPLSSAATAGEPFLSLAPGASARVRLRLEHQHVIYGDYDPLLGSRTVELKLGPTVVRDVVPLDREQYTALPKGAWPEIPEDRRDTRQFVSAPDSLHLEAHIPGHQYYRFPERPVRYGTKMRLRFRYLIAEGTEGDCRLRFSQVRDTPVSWRSLSQGNFEQCLKVVGRWTTVERIVRTDPEATHVAIEFGIVNDSYVGEMWIDDVSLEPLAAAQTGP